MITKKTNTVRKCCLYVSDFHLEMILLPYIKERINKSEILIFSQNDLSDTIKILLDRVYIKDEEKQNIINLDWKRTDLEDILINNFYKNDEEIHIIINGDYNYIKKVNNKINFLGTGLHIIDCFNINEINFDICKIRNNYTEIINTSKI